MSQTTIDKDKASNDNAPDKNRVLALISETHWDREWYLPFEGFRFKLVETIDKALRLVEQDPKYVNFTLDGQAVVLEDYLAARPRNETRLAKAIRDNRISTGPFYILPDEFLISAEAHVRNLMLGMAVVRRFGEPSLAGYMPDSFGHIAQVPQILDGFNIDNFFFTRGMGDEAATLGSEFTWTGQDGKTSILAVNLPLGYGNIAGLTRDQDNFAICADRVKRVVETLKKRASTNVLLLMNGVDHLKPEEKISAFIEYFNQLDGGAAGTIKHVTLPDYIALLKDAIRRARVTLKQYQGDFRGGKEHLLLSDVFSSRVYLLQQNVQSEILMERLVEPLSALADWALKGDFTYPADYIWLAWRYLLKNHPHDSICGCSVDEVHQDMMYRFRHVKQLGAVLSKDAARYLMPRIDFHPGGEGPRFGNMAFEMLVFNPSTFPRSGQVEFWVETAELGEDTCPEVFWIYDETGNKHPSVNKIDKTPPLLPGKKQFRSDYYKFQFMAGNVPALGYKTYYLVPVDDEPTSAPAGDWVSIGQGTMESADFKITVNQNGTFTIEDKVHGARYENQGLLIDEPDFGDEYDFMPLPKDHAVVTSGGSRANVSSITIELNRARMQISTSIDVPMGIKEDRSGVISEKMSIPVTITIELCKGMHAVGLHVSVDNRAKDHRLRVAFPSGLVTGHKLVGQHYTVLEKPITLPEGKGWVQAPSTTDHFLSFVGIAGNDQLGHVQGLAIVTGDSQEHEVNESTFGKNVIIVTLVRSVGWLGRPNGGAGPDVRTPDAQCQGMNEFKMQVIPFKPVNAPSGRPTFPRDFFTAVDEALVPLHVIIPHNLDDFHNTEPLPAVLNYRRFDLPRMLLVDENNEKFVNKEKLLPATASFVSLSPASMVFTSLKKSEAADGYILRFYNAGRDAADAVVTLHPSLKFSNVKEVKLDEHTGASKHDVNRDGSKVTVNGITHDEIVTLKFLKA